MDMRSLWFKDKDGKPDPVLTFTFLSVVVMLFKLLLAGATIKIGQGFAWTIVAPDATVLAAAWTPTLGAYVANKYVNYNFHPDYVKMRMDVNKDGVEEEVMVPRTAVKPPEGK